MEVADLDWTKLRSVAELESDVLPVAVQDADTGGVVMVAYATREAAFATLDGHEAVFWSTSKNELHRKGDTSGDVLDVIDVRVNCERNSLLYVVRLRGEGACHVRDETGRAYQTCFHQSLLRVSGSGRQAP